MIIKTEKNIKHLKEHHLPELLPGSTVIKRRMSPEQQRKIQYRQALKKIEQLERELKQVAEARFQEGFEQGREGGKQEALQLVQEKVEALGQVIAALKKQEQTFLENCEDFVVKFSFRVVERILGQEVFSEIELKQEQLREVVAEAVSYYSESTKYLLHVNGRTLPMVEEMRPQLEKSVGREIQLVVVEDPALRPGECLVESDYGVLDARFASQFEELKQHFVMKR